jgi:hypothetical protein
MFDPDRWPSPGRHRQRATDGDAASRTIVVEEGHPYGDWSDPSPLEQVAQLLHHLDPEAVLPSESSDCSEHRVVSPPIVMRCPPAL